MFILLKHTKVWVKSQYRFWFSLCCGQYRLWQSRLWYSIGYGTVCVVVSIGCGSIGCGTVWVMLQYRLWQVEVVASRG